MPLVQQAKANLGAAQRLLLALCLAMLPFELVAGLGLGPLTLTNLELLAGAALACWAALLVAEGRRPAVPPWLAIGAAAVVGTLLLSAAMATAERTGALKFALRQGQGALLALCLADTMGRGARPGPFVAALLAGAGASALLGLIEMSEAPAALALLAPFKTEATYMGGLLRLSGSFSYANTAAQYYEALLPLAVLAALGSPGATAPAGRPWPTIGAALVAAVLLLATLLTYSRAALAVTVALLLLTPLVARRAFGGGAGARAGLACAGLAALGLALAVLSPTVRLRVSEPEVASWYGARYTPAAVAPMQPNELREVPIVLTNSGRVAWPQGGLRPVRLAYHWLDATTGALVKYEGRRTPLPRAVAPGETLELRATVQAPARPGRYVLVWDLLREYTGRGWFSQLGVAPARVTVEVAGVAAPVPPPAADPPTSPRAIAAVPGPPGRGELWGVAVALWRERPLVGIGPDVYRHVYGPALGLERWDTRVHTNNLYLELLTGAGLLGLAAFLGLAGAALWNGWRALGPGRLGHGELTLLAGALLAIVAFLGHGLLDVFLAFTPTYVLLWAMLGALGGLAARDREIHSADSLRIDHRESPPAHAKDP